MFSIPERYEIDHHTIKLIVGLIAVSLATLTSIFAGGTIASISASYHVGGWSRDIFVGFLFAIAAFLLAYNGNSRPEMLLSKLAAIAGNRRCVVPLPMQGQSGDHPLRARHLGRGDVPDPGRLLLHFL